MDDIKLQIKGREKETFAIHYACSGFYGGGAIAPTICSIVLTNIKTNEVHTFALQNYIVEGKCIIDAEKQLLTDFATFFEALKNPILIHWKMNGLEYGFKAITGRCENYGIYNLSFSDVDTIDLEDIMFYSLQGALAKNNCASADILGGKEEANCFNQRNYNAVKLSTVAKSKGLAKLVKKMLSDTSEIDDGYDEKIY